MPDGRTSGAARRRGDIRRASERTALRAGLVYIDDHANGIRRLGSAANGFRYLEERTRRPISRKERSRIRSLAIPPVYQDVSICLQNLGIHAEYEKFDTDVVGDLDLITVGATYSFGAR